ncbi:MAG: hypothetical protein QXY40_08315 [Candidatus Methanomethylicia archaeon]
MQIYGRLKIFESDTSDIPVDIAKELGLWPPYSATTAIPYTGGGKQLIRTMSHTLNYSLL